MAEWGVCVLWPLAYEGAVGDDVAIESRRVRRAQARPPEVEKSAELGVCVLWPLAQEDTVGDGVAIKRRRVCQVLARPLEVGGGIGRIGGMCPVVFGAGLSPSGEIGRASNRN